MPSKRFLSTAAPLALLALAGMGLATAQSSSPFASNKKAQAWETPASSQARAQPQAWQNVPQAAPTPSYAAQPYSAPSYSAPSYSAPKTAATS